jgi:transketolase
LFDYYIYTICSDGDIMEGIASESASLAGHLKLGNLIYFYDDNQITIEGNTSLAFNEDVTERFQAYGWHVQSVADGNDTDAILNAIDQAKKETGRPSLIKVRTHIGFGSPNKVDTAAAHGSPLGKDEVRLVKENFGFDPDESFVVPEKVLNYYRNAGKERASKEKDWKDLYKKYQEQFPAEYKEYDLFRSGKLPEGWDDKLPSFKPDAKGIATRKASGKMLNAIAPKLPLLIGSSWRVRIKATGPPECSRIVFHAYTVSLASAGRITTRLGTERKPINCSTG